uniref:Uncharacterized protein n=1 Tax=viral metagenome TaxID=1070528 RepID=A0A6M3LDQ4_9ZZZZ
MDNFINKARRRKIKHIIIEPYDYDNYDTMAYGAVAEARFKNKWWGDTKFKISQQEMMRCGDLDYVVARKAEVVRNVIIEAVKAAIRLRALGFVVTWHGIEWDGKVCRTTDEVVSVVEKDKSLSKS